MSTGPTPSPTPRRFGLPSGVTTVVWVLVVAWVIGYLALVAIGAWNPAEVVVPTVLFAIAVLLLVVLSVEARRGAIGAGGRDPRLVRDRERRGF